MVMHVVRETQEDDLLMSLSILFVIVAKSCLILTDGSPDSTYLNQGKDWVSRTL